MADDTKETGAGSPDELLLEWRVHLLVEQPGKSVALCVLCGFVLVLIHFLFGQRVGFTILAAAILLGSLSDWFLPLKYRLTTRGASYSNLVFGKRMAWEEVRSCYVSSFGLKLSPFSRRTRLDAFRGFVLRFAGNRDEVIRIVKERATNRQR
jgi:hypothetical protein